MKYFPKVLALSMALVAIAVTGMVARADAPLVSVTGTIVSRDGDVLVVQTDRGNLTFDLDKSTDMPATLPVGSRITVWYDSDDKPEDKMDARRITMTPEANVNTTPPPATPPPSTTTTETRTEETTQTEQLPATASPLPLMGATGLLSLLGGGLFLLRSRRK
jgi:LPXTG-motif cell wall-anchored protein